MDSNVIIEALSDELQKSLKNLEKSKKIEEKVQLSEVIKNLSESLSVFLSMPCGYQANDVSDEDENEINQALEDKLA